MVERHHDHHHHDHHHHDHHHHDHHHLEFDDATMVEHAESEAVVFESMLTSAMSLVADHCRRAGTDVARIIDLGCGPGVGTAHLARTFADAHVTAVDGAPAMLARVTEIAQGSGVGARVTTRHAEFPDGIDTLGAADLLWASMVIHHIGDETDAFRRIRTLLAPSGVLAVVERAGPTRIRLDDHPELFDAIDAAWSTWFAGMRAELPGSTATTTYPDMLHAAGFELLGHHTVTATVGDPASDAVRRLGYRQVARSRDRLEGHLAGTHLRELDALIDRYRRAEAFPAEGLRVDASRDLFVARPAGLS